MVSIAGLRSVLRGRVRSQIEPSGARPAAVLVPIVAATHGLEILCFERTHAVLEHKGEICLPGGSVDPIDAGPVEAALREAHEELGIDAADVEVLGILDDVHTTVSNYVITPVVAFLASPPALVLDALEVQRPIAVSISNLVAHGARWFEHRSQDGRVRRIYAYDVGNDRIWGATARIIHGLLALWFGADGDES